MVRTIAVEAGSGKYPVVIGSGLSKSLLKKDLGRDRATLYVLTSPEIWSLWGAKLSAALAPAKAVVLFLRSGERYKRLVEVERLASELAAAGADRSSMLVAFGGGVVGDVGGFLSAIYMRGMDYIQIPTTLLAQVDSSVGGKTGVNLREGKNLVGCFHHPRAVFADVDFLNTLSTRELRAGLYESIKAGLIRDASLFRFIEANAKQIDRREAKVLERIVTSSIRMKAEVVALDERESGLRMILNFGHTVGHAIESTGRYGGLLHGEAVAWGMLVALRISSKRKWLMPSAADRAERVIRRFEPPALSAVHPRRLLEAASRDKKNRAGVRRFVLLKGIGKAVIAEDVTDEELVAAIDSALCSRQSGSRR